MPEQKVMDLTEFRNEGYLLEANRQFFHPLGLALGFEIDGGGNVTELFIIDNRDSPLGMTFEDLSDEDSVNKYLNVLKQTRKKFQQRLKKLGYLVQPIELPENNPIPEQYKKLVESTKENC